MYRPVSAPKVTVVDAATRAARKAALCGKAPSAAMAAASGGATSGGVVGAVVMLTKVALSAALGVDGVDGVADDACKDVEEDSAVVARVVAARASSLGVSPVSTSSLCDVECCSCCCL